MNAIAFIAASLETSKNRATTLLRDMQDAPFASPCADGGNHPLWILGHLAYSEAMLLDQFLLGRPNRFDSWKGLFAPGTTPSADAGKYPTMGDLFAAFDAARADTLAHLKTLTDADLERPSRVPAEFSQPFGTVGKCLAAAIVHPTYHAGQVADCRRAAGRKPLFL